MIENKNGKKYSVARIVSFVVLIAILVIMGILFFRVMSNFILPLFLASLLVVIFSPLHAWCLNKCRYRHHLAALLTTVTILIIVLVPLLVILWEAAVEGYRIYNSQMANLDIGGMTSSVVQLGEKLGIHNLSEDVIKTRLTEELQSGLAPIALATTQYLGNFLIGLVVMMIAVFYFFADGPAMIQGVKDLMPLNIEDEEKLIVRFIDVSRAVVVATIAAALMQGAILGLTFYFLGFKSIFLITILAILASMIPFVGSSLIWIPGAAFLYFNDERTAAAIFLLIFGWSVMMVIDNIIKPLILHGKSNLHPLLAFLSVLGGVQALGPIGIFVGPMVVAFLQTLLKMFHDEMARLDSDEKPDLEELAASVDT